MNGQIDSSGGQGFDAVGVLQPATAPVFTSMWIRGFLGAEKGPELECKMRWQDHLIKLWLDVSRAFPGGPGRHPRGRANGIGRNDGEGVDEILAVKWHSVASSLVELCYHI